MYPFDAVRPAWERLWSAVHQRAPWTPSSLRSDGDVHDHWSDPACRVAQACGWPVVTALRGVVEVVGAFSLALDGADGHRYRSVLLANRPGSVADFARVGTVAAVNGGDSLSGWVSLVAATVGPGQTWPGSVRWTGGHVESLRLIGGGGADIASVDALSLGFVRRHHAHLLAGLHEVGRGPWVPSLPIVTRAGTPAPLVSDLRDAFTDALGAPELADVRDALFLDGFVALDDGDYRPLVDLAPRANVGTFVPDISQDHRQC